MKQLDLDEFLRSLNNDKNYIDLRSSKRDNVYKYSIQQYLSSIKDEMAAIEQNKNTYDERNDFIQKSLKELYQKHQNNQQKIIKSEMNVLNEKKNLIEAMHQLFLTLPDNIRENLIQEKYNILNRENLLKHVNKTFKPQMDFEILKKKGHWQYDLEQIKKQVDLNEYKVLEAMQQQTKQIDEIFDEEQFILRFQEFKRLGAFPTRNFLKKDFSKQDTQLPQVNPIKYLVPQSMVFQEEIENQEGNVDQVEGGTNFRSIRSLNVNQKNTAFQKQKNQKSPPQNNNDNNNNNNKNTVRIDSQAQKYKKQQSSPVNQKQTDKQNTRRSIAFPNQSNNPPPSRLNTKPEKKQVSPNKRMSVTERLLQSRSSILDNFLI